MKIVTAFLYLKLRHHFDCVEVYFSKRHRKPVLLIPFIPPKFRCWQETPDRKHDINVAIILSSAKPVSVGLISDLKELVNQAIEENVTVAVYALQEAGVKRAKF